MSVKSGMFAESAWILEVPFLLSPLAVLALTICWRNTGSLPEHLPVWCMPAGSQLHLRACAGVDLGPRLPTRGLAGFLAATPFQRSPITSCMEMEATTLAAEGRLVRPRVSLLGMLRPSQVQLPEAGSRLAACVMQDNAWALFSVLGDFLGQSGVSRG